MSELYSIIPVENRPIDGFPNYRIGIDGSLWGNKPGRFTANGWYKIKLVPDAHGYITVHLFNGNGKQHARTVHGLVLSAFISTRPQGCEARHKNGIKTDNRADNLEWGTRQENSLDKRRHGTDNAGERHSMAKLTEADVGYIRTHPELKHVSLARMFGVCDSAIRAVRNRKSWRHIA